MFKNLTQNHLIYILLALAVSYPLIKPMGLPLEVSPNVQMAYDAVENIPNGSTVLWIWDCAPASFNDVGASGIALGNHMFKKDLKLIAVTFMENSIGNFDRAMAAIEYEGKVYGTDYVDLGFAAGLEPTVAALADDLHATKPKDRAGNSIATLPITKDVKNIKDISLIVSMSSGSPGTEAVIRQIALRYPEIPVVSACAAGQATRFYVYLDSGHLTGLLPGLRAGAEYERLIDKPAYGTSAMDALSVQHLFIIGLLVVGNIIHFRDRAKNRRGVIK